MTRQFRGADPIETRTGFADGVRTIIVETASRFARDLMLQEVGLAKLRELGIELVAADSPNAFLDDGPTSKLILQVLGAVAEFDKAMTVAKFQGARQRKRREAGEKVEGRKSHVELRPEVFREAKRLRRASPLNGGRRSFRKISKELAAMASDPPRHAVFRLGGASYRRRTNARPEGGKMTSDALRAIRAAYYEAGRLQPAAYPQLTVWDARPIELREAFIPVYAAGHAAALKERK